MKKKPRIFCFFLFLSAFSFAGVPGESGGLELIDFSVIQNINKIDIRWSTSSVKTGGPYFCVEKSKDGVNFVKVVDIPATEGSNFSDYFETDYQPYAGVSYYRIKQVDPEGNFRYSQVVTLKTSEEKEPETLSANTATGEESALKEIKADDAEILLVLRDKDGNDTYSKVAQGKQLELTSSVKPGTYRIIGASKEKMRLNKINVK